MHASCVLLGGVAFDLSLWGRGGGGAAGAGGGGYAWHTRSALSSPQEINLFERAAGLKIGRSPKTIALGINCPVLARRREDSGEETLAPGSVCVCVKHQSGPLVVLFVFCHIFQGLRNHQRSRPGSQSPPLFLSLFLSLSLYSPLVRRSRQLPYLTGCDDSSRARRK